MTELNPLMDQYQTAFARMATGLPYADQPESTAQREAAMARFAEFGFPDTRIESWKYSDTRVLQKQCFTPAEAIELTPEQLKGLLPARLDAYRLVFVNGHFVANHSDLSELPKGIRLGTFSQQDSDSVPPNNSKGAAHALLDMNLAFATDGLNLDIDADVSLERPIYALFVATPTGDGQMLNTRNRISLGKNASATVIEHYVSANDLAYFNNCVSHIELAANTQLKRVRLQLESSKASQVGATTAILRRDSRLNLHSVDLGGRWLRYDSDIRLIEPGAEVHMDGLYVPTGRQHIDNHTCVEHEAPHCISREDYKGILDGGARGVFNGRIVVHKDAQKTDSEQSSAALLLSSKAEIDAKPELEIYADDVKCKHGATVGQLDERAVFYLQSRGLDEVDARNLLTYSFADELLQRLELPVLQKHIEAALLKKLPNSERLVELL